MVGVSQGGAGGVVRVSQGGAGGMVRVSQGGAGEVRRVPGRRRSSWSVPGRSRRG